MKTLTVYILLCCDSSYYVGVTNNILRRFDEHSSGINPLSYTFKRRPLQIVYLNEFTDFHAAIAWEKQIKGWSRAKKQALIEANFDLLKELSKCNNLSSHVYYKPED